MFLLERKTERRGRSLPAALQRLADARPAQIDGCEFRSHDDHPLLLLAFLAEDAFAGIFDALALVGLGPAEFADFGGDLANPLLVDAA